MKRKSNDEQSLHNKREKLITEVVKNASNDSQSSIDGSAVDADIDSSYVPVGGKRSTKKKDIIKGLVCTVADKYQISHRALTELFAAHIIEDGGNVDEYNLSVMNTHRA